MRHTLEPPKVTVSLFAEPDSRNPSTSSPVGTKSVPAHLQPVDSDALLYSEDLSVGDCWTTPLRRISESDVDDFANLTGDHTPLHGQAGSPSPFGKPVAHGLLGLSILAGLGSNSPKASTLALVGIEEWQFSAPVFIGESVAARNEIVSIEPHGRRAVKVRWLRQLLNEAGRAVQQGYFVTLVGSRHRGRAKPR